MNGLKVTVKPKQLEKIAKRLDDRINRNKIKAMTATTLSGVTTIELRTKQSQSYKGKEFKKYSPAYAAKRERAGLTTTPDLSFKGTMLNSLTGKADKKEGVIFFSRATESRKAAFNNKTRPFMGFSKKEREGLADVYRKYLLPRNWNK